MTTRLAWFVTLFALCLCACSDADGRATPSDRDAGALDASLGRGNKDAGRDSGLEARAPQVDAQAVRFCPGYEPFPQSVGAFACSVHDDCDDPRHDRGLCIADPTSDFCCSINPERIRCTDDLGCDGGLVCQSLCNDHVCSAPCQEQDGYRCDTDEACIAGHCLKQRCDGPSYRCTAPSVCQPDAGTADEHGCVAIPCSQDDDCPCGACVNGWCWPRPGFCHPIYCFP